MPMVRAHVGARGRSANLATWRFNWGSPTVDEYDLTRLITHPSGNVVQEFDRMGLVTGALVADETLAAGEIVGAIPVDAFSQRGTAAQTPSGFALGRPGVAQVHIAVQMGFIDIEQADIPATKPRQQFLELLDKGGTTLRIGLLEHFLAFLPTQSLSPQDSVQGRAAAGIADDLCKPTSQLFQGPGMAWQAMVERVGLDDRADELIELLLAKRGWRPPV